MANRLATGGESWVDLMQRQKSGTYNNQWMVLDADVFQAAAAAAPAVAPAAGASTGFLAQLNSAAAVKAASQAESPGGSSGRFPAGLFWVLEEAPGLTHAEDMSAAFLGLWHHGHFAPSR